MKTIECPLSGVYILEPKIFGDDRGFFFESYNSKIMEGLGFCSNWIQDNHSRSAKNVLRGLHWQTGSAAQDKLVRVISGAVFDVVVDIRLSSPSFGKWFGLEISAINKRQLLIPKGFAHGFLTLEDGSEFLYKCSAYYHPPSERGLSWCDSTIGIEWPLEPENFPTLSSRDRQWSALESCNRADLFP